MRLPPYPLVVALWLVLVQWRQAGAVAGRWGDLGTSLAAAAMLALFALGLGTLVGRERPRGDLVALVVVLWGALYGTFVVLSGPWTNFAAGEAVMAWTLLCALLVVGARRAPVGVQLSQALGIGALLLVAVQGLGLARSAMPARAAAVATGIGRSAERPDVYLIVLDKYNATRWLAEHYGFDNRPMEDSLRALGFFVPAQARSNYPHTGLVLASFLNGRPVQEMLPEESARWSAVNERIEHARAWEFLRERGYRLAFFPTTYSATLRNRTADLVLQAAQERPARRGARRPARRAAHTWRANAPLAALVELLRCGRRGCPVARPTLAALPYPLESAAAIRGKFDLLASLPDSAGPIVAFFHVLAPHEPYQFTATCADRDPWWPLSDEHFDAEVRDAYVAQVQCVNALVLRAVRALLARSELPPIILVQSDHGHGRITRDAMGGRTLRLAELSPTQLRERLDVFAAYHAPGVEAAWYDSISPINVLPTVFNARFGAQWPTHADRAWWADDFQSPLRLQELTAADFRLNTDARPSP